jgi:hypothetical protein
MTAEPKLLTVNNLDTLSPKITSLSLERRDKTFLSLLFQVDSKLNDKKTSWIFDPKVINFLNITITLSINEQLSNSLQKNNIFLFGTKISESAKYVNGRDYLQINRKINSSAINYAKTATDSGEQQIVSTFSENLEYQLTDIKHLSIFISVYLDNLEISKKFNIGTDKLKNIIGTWTREDFIANSLYKNSKISDISIFKQKDKFQFNSISLLDETISNILKLQSQLLNKSNLAKNYISEFNYTLNSELKFNGFFIVNLENIFNIESRFPGFFANRNFNNNFFANSINYLPTKIILYRTKLADSTIEILYSGQFNDNIENEKCKISKIDTQSTRNKKISLSFIDKESNTFNEKYKYSLDLYFEDKTIQYLDTIFDATVKQSKKVEEILNIANYGKYYSLSLNVFDASLFDELRKHNLSIEESIKNTGSLLSQFLNFEQNNINNILLLSRSKYYNFEILETILDILNYFKSEITKIRNLATNTSTKEIVIKQYFNDIIDFSIKNENILEILSTTNQNAYSEISTDDLRTRISEEVQKFYSTDKVNVSNKFSYLTPSALKGSGKTIKQNGIKVSSLNYDDYNDFIINVYMSKLYKGNFSKFSRYEKLIFILNQYGIYLEDEKTDYTKVIDPTITRITNNKFNSKVEDLSQDVIDTLFKVFVECIILKETRINDYSQLKSDTKNTATQQVDQEKIPLQTLSVIQSLQDDKLTNLSSDNIKDIENDSEKIIGSYLNIKKVYEIQTLNVDDLTWTKMDESKLNNLNDKQIIARYVPVVNDDTNTKNNDKFDLTETNKIFVIKGSNKPSTLVNKK